MKVKKTRNNNIYLIIIFISISFFSSIGFSTIQSSVLDKNFNGIYNDANSVNFSVITGGDNLGNKDKKQQYASADFLKCINKVDNVYLEKRNIIVGAYIGRSIYFNYDIDGIPNMIEGRYFNIDDFKNDTPKAVVGKKVKDIIVTNKDGKKYLEYENNKYEIIGIFGYEDRETVADNQFIINFNAEAKKNTNVNETATFIINSDTKFYELQEQVFKQNKNIKLVEDKEGKPGMISSLIESRSSILVLIILIILIFLNVFNITVQWVSKKKKEIAIKKAVGGTNLKIALEIILENLKLATISFVIGYAIYFIIMKLQLISVLSSSIYILATIFSMIFSLFVSLLTSIVSIYKVLKIEPAITMKGGRM